MSLEGDLIGQPASLRVTFDILITFTVVIAIAAILGVAILIMLALLAYCLVKGRRKSGQHQRVPVNTIPVTFEDRERLVYNTTTKPI